jgi:hypothetical protein
MLDEWEYSLKDENDIIFDRYTSCIVIKEMYP